MGIEKVIDTADDLNGGSVSAFTFGPEGVDDNQLAFTTTLDGGGSAVYRAKVTFKPLPTLASSLLTVSRSVEVAQTATAFAALID